MLAKNCTVEQIERAAKQVKVKADIRDVRNNSRSESGVQIRFGLLPLAPEKRYQRGSASYFHQGRKVNAVCWHGHRDFFRALFARAPHADIKTALGHYTSAEQFESVYRSTDRNIGAPIAPIMASEACYCPEGGF